MARCLSCLQRVRELLENIAANVIGRFFLGGHELRRFSCVVQYFPYISVGGTSPFEA